MAAKTIKCGIVGYGGAFNIGRHHAEYINARDGMSVVAVCDKELPRIAAFGSLSAIRRTAASTSPSSSPRTTATRPSR